ncbi:MAG: zinc ABC transporter substrate-binding protein [Deltaproteobacteria bacterium]|nr:zinc ABC transporter substrate-binding protein [Deltaproteobacteria bacterium]MBW1923118.1 zinc ABC transporter substrate-binding protein [Deltaproteobacteria bacterium]MBW1949142.1 zinc ABC transporter substrate-binding protein [Deltaproteobacteria bacterium]MBW2346678.1 zinc ABC transporter substrate-binding protein [Deltaproteobacteria bacterium]RLB32864.1 MAG: cation ABC transporter substrate-binding protein [Deltaproteobacteria bacterium]
MDRNRGGRRLQGVGRPLLLVLFLASLLSQAAVHAESRDRLRVFVSIPPQKYFVERIGRKNVRVSVMVRPGANPATYEPSPSQMASLSRARVYFATGVPFEKTWLSRFAKTAPRLRIVHTDRDIKKLPMRSHRHEADRDGKSARRESAFDPHVWLSPPLVLLQARVVLEGLTSADPARSAIYEQGYREFVREIVDLDLELRRLFRDRGRAARFISFHPAWGYFARAYGLEQVAVELEGKEPKPAELAKLIRYARKAGMRAVFVQPQFPRRSAEVLAREIGGKIMTADPLAADWAANLREVARKLSDALR